MLFKLHNYCAFAHHENLSLPAERCWLISMKSVWSSQGESSQIAICCCNDLQSCCWRIWKSSWPTDIQPRSWRQNFRFISFNIIDQNSSCSLILSNAVYKIARECEVNLTIFQKTATSSFQIFSKAPATRRRLRSSFYRSIRNNTTKLSFLLGIEVLFHLHTDLDWSMSQPFVLILLFICNWAKEFILHLRRRRRGPRKKDNNKLISNFLYLFRRKNLNTFWNSRLAN